MRRDVASMGNLSRQRINSKNKLQCTRGMTEIKEPMAEKRV